MNNLFFFIAVSIVISFQSNVLFGQKRPVKKTATPISKPKAAAQTCTPPPTGLVSWWPGDGNANDIANANNGTLVGGATFAAGKVGQAFSFDGVNDYVSVPSTWGGRPETTIDAWVKTSATTGDFQAIVSSTASGEFVHLQLFSLGNIVAYTDGGVVLMPIVLQTPTGVYRHIAFSIKSGDSRLYVDGQLVGSNTLTFTTINPTSNVRIGSGFSGGRFFKGDIDEVEIFDRALSPTEIQAIFNAGSAGKCKVQTVAIDIKPGSSPNIINLSSLGNIPVAILTTNGFNAAAVDPTTVRFGATGSEAAPVQSARKDVDGDGDTDMILHFKTQDTGIVSGDTSASLKGETLSGQPIKGSDSIKTVRRGRK